MQLMSNEICPTLLDSEQKEAWQSLIKVSNEVLGKYLQKHKI